jgi:hypothetical protein
MSTPAERLAALADRITPDGIVPLPSRLICLWSGPVAGLPEGWALCDGTDGTADLRELFIKAKPHSPQLVYVQKK